MSVLGGGQIIEFTAGYTVPKDGLCGGLDPITGEPTTGSSVGADETFTIPPWFGSRGSNVDNSDPPIRIPNDAFEFERRVGCVLTITDHPISRRFRLDNKSTRIIGYRRVELRNPSNELQIAYHRYQILPFEGVSVADTLAYLANTGRDLAEIPKDEAKADYVINGTPFSGAGAGFNPATGVNDAGYTGTSPENQPFALLPNPTDPGYHQGTAWLAPNEDYDAADFQNMLLALQTSDGRTVSPSLHRPELAHYWFQRQVAGIAAVSSQLAWKT
ncbi:MAG: hypothetical protein ACOX1P_00140 [Thermoguttaceae bacterium]